MSGDFLVFVIAIAGLIGLSDALILYSVYLSLSVWRGLAVPIFRSRALWMALFGIPFAAALTYAGITRVLIDNNSPLTAPILSEVIFTFALVTLFVWIDRMVNSVIRLDYLRRDVLSWKRFRFAYWALFAIGNVFFFARYIYGSELELVSIPLVLGALAYGFLCLAKGGRTTRDTIFRSHLKWFGYFGATFIPTLLIYGLYALSVPIPVGLLQIAVSYCFYKMARFLVPVGKFSLTES